MASRTDIQLDDSNDLLIADGDFKIDVSDQYHIEAIIETWVGHWKEFPFVGVGIDQYLGSSGLEQQMKREMKLQIELDGYTVTSITVVDGDNFYIDANL